MCPFSRKIRIFANEISFDCEFSRENYRKLSASFLAISPAGVGPVMDAGNGVHIMGSDNICDYIRSYCKNNSVESLIGSNMNEYHEIRSVNWWFDVVFYNDIVKSILEEKLYLDHNSTPNVYRLRTVRSKLLNLHFKYMSSRFKQYEWLGSNSYSLADITAASHLSVIDYFGDIPWNRVSSDIIEWYSTIKSKISFRFVLDDTIEGFKPSASYIKLDI